MFEKYIHLILYVIFGVLTTIVNLISYKLFLDMNIDYRISATLAFILAVLFAFITNRKYVFTAQSDFWQEAAAFFGMRGFTFLINLIGLIFLVQYVKWDEFYSQVFINIIVIVLNYILSKYFVFNLKNIKEYLKTRVSVFDGKK